MKYHMYWHLGNTCYYLSKSRPMVCLFKNLHHNQLKILGGFIYIKSLVNYHYLDIKSFDQIALKGRFLILIDDQIRENPPGVNSI